MSFSPPNSRQAYVPNDLIIPDDFPDANLKLTDYIREVVDALNIKDIGQYDTVELLNGQTYFTAGDATKQRQVFRKVINFGALPNAATKSVVHGISVADATIFTRIYGTATHPTNNDPNRKAIPLPYVEAAGVGNMIELYATDTNVVMITGIDYSAYTTSYVVLEYILN